jgi:hypothetical protein
MTKTEERVIPLDNGSIAVAVPHFPNRAAGGEQTHDACSQAVNRTRRGRRLRDLGSIAASPKTLLGGAAGVKIAIGTGDAKGKNH